MTWPQAIDTWRTHEWDAVLKTLSSGRLTMGPQVAKFERLFAEYVGSRHAIMVNSGSSANLVAVAALFYDGRLKRGDHAIVPGIAWATTYAPLLQFGLRLTVVDVDRETLNASAAAVKAAITEHTKLIVAVSVLGNPAGLRDMQRTAALLGISLLEDNCESLGARHDGKHCGTFGDIGTYSFFFSHHINTVEGGMLVTDNDDLADLARCLRAHGWTRDLAAGSKLRKPHTEFEQDYDFAVPGFNVRPTEIPAAAGIAQLERIEAFADMRRLNAERFDNVILGSGWRSQERSRGAVPFALTLLPLVPGKRADLVTALKAKGIESRPIAGGCFARQRAAKYYDWAPHDALVNAEYVHDNGLMIGNHPVNLANEIDQLGDLLK